MSSKYSTLPDLDTAPDVYESIPASSSSTQEQEQTERLTRLRSDLTALLESEALDSSESEGESGLNESEGESDVVAPDTAGKTEIGDEKAARESSDRGSPALSEASTSALLAQVASLSYAFARAQPSLRAGTDRSAKSFTEKPDTSSIAAALDDLEHFVGLGDTQLDSSPDTGAPPLLDVRGSAAGNTGSTEEGVPLAVSLSQLEHQVSLLTQPRHLDAVTRKVKLLAGQLERSAAFATGGSPSSHPPRPTHSSALSSATSFPSETGVPTDLDPEASQHLASLVRLQSRLEPLLPLPSVLITRMRSLSTVHAQGADVASALARVGGDLDRLRLQQRQMTHLASSLTEALDENHQMAERNWHSLAARTDRLQSRLAKLCPTLQQDGKTLPLLVSNTQRNITPGIESTSVAAPAEKVSSDDTHQNPTSSLPGTGSESNSNSVPAPNTTSS